MNRIMIDLETLGTDAGCVILAIGAVRFEGPGGVPPKFPEFYRKIDPSSCTRIGMQVDPDTVLWWMKQAMENPDAAKELVDPADREPIHDALIDFAEWLKEFQFNEDDEIWSNGATADLTWLSAAYRHLGLRAPWSYKTERCFRTIKALCSEAPELEYGDRVAHHALADATWQARQLKEWEIWLVGAGLTMPTSCADIDTLAEKMHLDITDDDMNYRGRGALKVSLAKFIFHTEDEPQDQNKCVDCGKFSDHVVRRFNKKLGEQVSRCPSCDSTRTED